MTINITVENGTAIVKLWVPRFPNEEFALGCHLESADGTTYQDRRCIKMLVDAAITTYQVSQGKYEPIMKPEDVLKPREDNQG